MTKIGKQAEKAFVQLFESKGHKVEKSTKEQDMFEHWDFLINDEHKMEIKSRKRANRNDSELKDDWIYLEFLNVIGKPGWLYGKADFIAFQRPEGFLVVKRTDLVELAERLVVHDVWSNRPQPYESFRRDSRPKERVSVLLIDDVLTIPHKVIK